MTSRTEILNDSPALGNPSCDVGISASVYIICRNEKSNITACITSLSGFADIVVVDSDSTDGTLDAIAELKEAGFPVRLFQREWEGFAVQKQFALDQCKYDWCLNLDADEYLSDDLRESIASVIGQSDGVVAYKIRRRDWMQGYGYVHRWCHHRRLTRLVRRSHAKYNPADMVHEKLEVEGKIGETLSGWIWHHQLESLEELYGKQNRYTTLKAQQRKKAGRGGSAMAMIYSPLWYFVWHFIGRRYFLCGWAGFIASVMSAQYAFQTAAKLFLAVRCERK